jgi:hypothetical protein
MREIMQKIQGTGVSFELTWTMADIGVSGATESAMNILASFGEFFVLLQII